ncbi:sugar phosphate isomerase/epimerase [Novosphingobium sp. G106]|uniref:sugar phosphate isomerase/epimerase family protein n=1 Tax=Novosphingobium sp. G106 TaxID=2849500 RepID=UPI001C2D87B5|nr:sugar phosphate isomerase/epimerase [Novosphingobium sp. G106]MBV1690517.1 sugar phosphate isomerase/epimerase [Novosphingobium sp. G106]
MTRAVTPLLSLDSLTLTATRPSDLIRAAGAAGFDLVSLWVQPPPIYPEALVTSAEARECAALLADGVVKVQALEVFDLTTLADLDLYRPALELGARLGGTTALVYNLTNPDRGEVVEVLAAFAVLASEYGLATNLEPVVMGRTATLGQAASLVEASGADVGLLYDLWHFVRAGGTAADLTGIAPGLIRYVQVNDGLAAIPAEQLIPESIGERLYPGEGEFPLVELLKAAPRDVPWAIETPSLRRANVGVTGEAQAIETLALLRELVAQTAWER